MAITISGENNNDRILAQDGVIDQISGINIVGVLTATSFVGNVTGNVTGNLTGNVNSTSPLLLQTGGSERFRITGNNELGIAGANYGSSGQVLTSGGSGSAVSWTTIPTQVTITSNADNRIITGGSGTNLVGESELTYTGGLLKVAATYPSFYLDDTNTTNNRFRIIHNNELTQIDADPNNVYAGSFINISVDGSERLRITSEGNVIIAETMAVNRPRIVLSAPNDGTNYRHLFGANLQVNSSGTFTTPTANISGGGWEYLPANSLNAHGQIRYLSAPDTNATSSTPLERLRIDATGRVLIGVDAATNSDSYVQAFKQTGNDATITVGNVATSASGLCRYDFAPSNKVVGSRIECHATEDFSTSANRTADLVFITRLNGTLSEKLRIASTGRVGIGSDNPGATLDLFSNDTEILLRLNTKPVKNGYIDIVSDANRRGVIRFQDSLADGGNYRWSIGNGDSDELSNTSFHISSGNSGGGAAKFIINSSGQVLIGTTTQAGKLTVHSGSANTCATFQSSDAGANINLKDNTARSTLEQNGNDLKISADTDDEDANSTIKLQVDGSTKVLVRDDGHVLFSGLTSKNDTRNAKGITIKSASGGGGISFQTYGANGSKNWRIRPDDLTGWGTLEFSVSPTTNSATDWPDTQSDVVLSLQPGREIDTGKKEITGGNNLAIQNFRVRGVWSGSPSIGKSIELISGYDSSVKMAAIGYNLTDTSLGSTYGGDLTFHTQPLYSSPTTPLPVRMRISSKGYVTKPETPAFFATHTGTTSPATGTLTYNTSGSGYYNNGSHLNTSTGKFTAPLAGIYHFHFHGFIQSNDPSDFFETTLQRTRSGSDLALTRQYGHNGHTGNNYGPSISMHCTTYLEKGDTVHVHQHTSGVGFHGSNGYYFGGYHIG